MSPLYDYSCTKCGEQFEEFNTMAKRQNQKCPKCGRKANLVISKMNNQLDCFKPYMLEHGVDEPVLITSREQRDRIFKENHIDQLPYPNRKYHPYSRIFPVSGQASRGSGTRWGGNCGLEY